MGLKKRGSIYWCVFQHNGRSYQVTTRTSSLREAQAFERRYRSEVESKGRDTSPVLIPTIALMRDLDLARAKKAEVSNIQLGALAVHWKRLGEFFTDVSKIDTAALDAYVERRHLTAKGQTYRRELQALQRGLSAAARLGYRVPTGLDWPKVESSRRDVKKRSKSHGIVRLRQWLLLLTGGARAEALMVLLTGLRDFELRRVKPGFIHRVEGQDVPAFLNMPEEATKNRLPRRIALTPLALDLIETWLPWLAADHKKQRSLASEKVGAVSTITLRDCRAAFGSAAQAVTKDWVAVKAAMGHTEAVDAVAMLYQHASDAQLAAVSLGAEKHILGTPALYIVSHPSTFIRDGRRKMRKS